MIPKESYAYHALKQVSRTVDYEMLTSRPGISEPDSNFIWASTFKAPIGISFIRDDVYFNLLLPKGSENENDKKIFLNRVGARYKDELWQVRRSMAQMDSAYGQNLKLAVSSLNSVVLDYAYIERGRAYAHLVFNSTELPAISQGILSTRSRESGVRVEYLRRTVGDNTVFRVIDRHEEVSAVTIEAVRNSGEQYEHQEGDPAYFLLGNVLDGGLRTICLPGKDGIPSILEPDGVTRIDDNSFSFVSRNQLIMDAVELMAEEFIVVYGSYGSSNEDTLTLTINIPSKQTPSLLKVLERLVDKSGSWKITLKEVMKFDSQEKAL